MLCERCGKEIEEDWRKDKKRPLRFCSRFCANARTQTKESNEKRRNKNAIATKLMWEKKPRKTFHNICLFCGKEFDTLPHKKRKLCSPECHSQYRSRQTLQRLKERPELIPYLLNHSSKGPSYPEKYWKEILELEKIPLKYHKRVGRYELDFFNEDKKIDLEIDGEQHYSTPENVFRDNRRTSFLEEKGWKIIRIRWKEWTKKSFEEKHQLLLEIRDLVT